MKDEFEEDFPSLREIERFHNYDFNFKMISEKDIQKHCLDKKRALEILNEPLALCSRHIKDDALIKNTQYAERMRIKKELGLE